MRPIKPIYMSLMAVALLLSACSGNKVLHLDSESGYFAEAGRQPPKTQSESITTNTTADLDSMRALIVVPDKVSIFSFQAEPNFTHNRVTEIGYFDEVINISQLRERLRQSQIEHPDLSDERLADADPLAMQAYANSGTPFLWLRWVHYKRSKNNRGGYYRLVLTEASTLKDLFVVKTDYQYTHGIPTKPPVPFITHKNNHFPMLNALIDYIKANSQDFADPPTQADNQQ